jgi:hypothetical protein
MGVLWIPHFRIKDGDIPFENVRLSRARVSNVDQNPDPVVRKKEPPPETLVSLVTQLQ